MKIKFSDILPNPYRNFETNPLNQEKIDELVASINSTGFWDNVVVRKNKEGKYELAYGHHRIEAAKKAGMTEADFIVKTFDDATMIRVMKNDNMEFGYSVLGYIEAVEAVVKGLAAGAIEAFKVPKDTPKAQIRYAPSYMPGEEPESKLDSRPYTTVDVAEFLGYTKKQAGDRGLRADNNVQAAIRALTLIEADVYKISMLKDWNTSQLLKNTQDSWDRLQEQRKRQAESTKNEAAKTKAIADQKAFEAEQKSKHEAAMIKVEAAEEDKRKAEREEKLKEVRTAEDRRKKAIDDEALRLLKAHADNAEKKLAKLGAPSVAIGATIEKSVKEAESILASRDIEAAEKLTNVLRKATEKITEAAKAKIVIDKPKVVIVNEDREPSVRVKRLASKFYSLMFEGDIDKGIEGDSNLGLIKELLADKATSLREKNLLYQAMKNAATRIDKWAERLREGKMPVSKQYIIEKPKGRKH